MPTIFRCGHPATGRNAMRNRNGNGKIGIRCRECYNALKRKSVRRRYHRLKEERERVVK